MEHRGEKLDGQIDEVRSDWERKRSDEAVPGATPPSPEEEAEDEDEGEDEAAG